MDIKELILQEFNEREIKTMEEKRLMDKFGRCSEKLVAELNENQRDLLKNYEESFFDMVYSDKEQLIGFVMELFKICK